MRNKHKKYIDKLVGLYADQKWKDEKIKYRSKGTSTHVWEMFLDRIAFFNYILLILISVYVAFIYMQDTTATSVLRAVYMDDIHMLEKKKGITKSILIAKTMKRDELNNIMAFTEVKYTNFSDEGNTDVIKANKALQYMKSKSMYFEGDVFFRSEYPAVKGKKNGEMKVDRFYSQKLNYDSPRKILTSEVPVRIHKGKNIVISGNKMWTNTRDNRTRVTEDVKITIYNKEEKL